MAVTTDGRLGCGRDIDEVWENSDDPPTDHETHCPHCRAARASLTNLNQATRELKTQDLTDPTLHLPQELLNKVISVARAEIRRGSQVPLRRTHVHTEPNLSVSQQAIAAVVWRASDHHLPTVETRHCSISNVAYHGDPTTPVEIGLGIEVSVCAGVSIPQVIGSLRKHLIAAVQEHIGITVSSIDVLVKDVHDV